MTTTTKKLPLFVRSSSLPKPGKDYKLSLPKEHLSFSQISLYLKCPAQYYHRYVLGLQSPKSVHLFEGLAVNHVMETSARRWSKKGQHLTPAEAENLHKKYVNQEKKTVESWFDVTEEDVVQRGEKFISLAFTDTMLSVIQPMKINGKLGVEYKWEKEIAGVPVVGIADLVTHSTIWDYKCVKKTPDADQSLQLSFYAVALNQPRVGIIAFLKQKTPALKLCCSTRSLRRTEQWLSTIVARVAYGISNEVWTPCDGESSWWCDPRWCGFYDECRGF